MFSSMNGSFTSGSLEFSVKKDHYLISYPSLDCGGEWILISSNKYKATFRENILEGVNKCVQGGTVVVTLVDKNHISYSYFSPDSGNLEATATLVNLNVIDVTPRQGVRLSEFSLRVSERKKDEEGFDDLEGGS